MLYNYLIYKKIIVAIQIVLLSTVPLVRADWRLPIVRDYVPTWQSIVSFAPIQWSMIGVGSLSAGIIAYFGYKLRSKPKSRFSALVEIHDGLKKTLAEEKTLAEGKKAEINSILLSLALTDWSEYEHCDLLKAILCGPCEGFDAIVKDMQPIKKLYNGLKTLQSMQLDDDDDSQSPADIFYAISKPGKSELCLQEIDIPKKFAQITYTAFPGDNTRFKEKYCLFFRINSFESNNFITIRLAERSHDGIRKFHKKIKGMVVGKMEQPGKIVWEKKIFMSDHASSSSEARTKSGKVRKQVSFNEAFNTTVDIPVKEKMNFFAFIDDDASKGKITLGKTAGDKEPISVEDAYDIILESPWVANKPHFP